VNAGKIQARFTWAPAEGPAFVGNTRAHERYYVEARFGVSRLLPGDAVRHLLLVAVWTLLLATQVGAAGPRSYDCVVTDFFHDDRYPLSDDWAELYRTMSISIRDAGNEVVVDTQVPGDRVESRSIEVTERTVDTVVASSVYEHYYRSAVTLRAPESLDTDDEVMGTLVYRTYETNHTWELRCETDAIGNGRPKSDEQQ
jgi:hypothetical protein